MKKILLSMLFVVAVATFVYAGAFPDVIQMKNKGYKKHKKGIIEFTHKKHFEDYKADCGECHHDKNGKPLKLKVGDPVEGCGECHSDFSKKKKKMKKADKIKKYHETALHANCKNCHKAFNKKKTGKKTKGPAPTSCTKCHPKKKK